MVIAAGRTARKAVRAVKSNWFQAEASAGRNGGKIMWKSIRDIQRSRRGLVPVQVTIVNDGRLQKLAEDELPESQVYDGKLFWRYTRSANVRVLTECLFADDGALVFSSRRIECQIIPECELKLWPDSQQLQDQTHSHWQASSGQ